MGFLETLEQLSISTWVRESPSIFAYATILWLHVMGMAVVAGISETTRRAGAVTRTVSPASSTTMAARSVDATGRHAATKSANAEAAR